MIEVTIDVTELIGNLKAKNMNGEPEMKSREMKKKKKQINKQRAGLRKWLNERRESTIKSKGIQ